MGTTERTTTSAPQMRLYEIADARRVLEEWLAESEGEVTPALEQLLAEVDASASEKIERVALFIRESLATAKAVKEEADTLAQRAKRFTSAAESLKGYLHRQMDALGRERVEGLLCTIALQKNPPRVVGDLDEETLHAMRGGLVPEWKPLVRHVPERYELDRVAALAAHKAGTVLPDGLTVAQGTSLRIR